MKKGLARIVLALFFLLAGSLHFTATDTEEQLVPAMLPYRRELVYLTGVWELLGGLGLLIPNARVQRLSSYVLVALLIAVFPANINHAVNNIQLGGMLNNQAYQWLRLPFQFVFIWWALWSTSSDTKRPETRN